MDKKPTRFDDLTEIARPVPVDATSYRLPSEVELELDDNDEWMIAWRAGGDAAPLRTHDDWMLSDFMELRDAEPEQIKEFAANWGTLQLCGHGKPQTHLPRRLWDELAEFDQAPCDVRRAYPGGWRTESVTRWRQYAAQATAIHRIARKLKADREIDRADLDPLEDLFPPNSFERPPPEHRIHGVPKQPIPTKDDSERILATAIHSWLGMGDVGFHIRWEDGENDLIFGGTGLFGALALQLALTTTGNHRALYLCSECRMPYPPDRKPRAGESNYCESCRAKGTPGRNRQRKRRAKGGPQTNT